jgi:hypothetical protein
VEVVEVVQVTLMPLEQVALVVEVEQVLLEVRVVEVLALVKQVAQELLQQVA